MTCLTGLYLRQSSGCCGPQRKLIYTPVYKSKLYLKYYLLALGCDIFIARSNFKHISASTLRTFSPLIVSRLRIEQCIISTRLSFSQSQKEGVNFVFNITLTKLRFNPDGESTTVTDIGLIEDGLEQRIKLNLADIVVATPGIINAGADFGTNKASTPLLSTAWED